MVVYWTFLIQSELSFVCKENFNFSLQKIKTCLPPISVELNLDIAYPEDKCDMKPTHRDFNQLSIDSFDLAHHASASAHHQTSDSPLLHSHQAWNSQPSGEIIQKFHYQLAIREIQNNTYPSFWAYSFGPSVTGHFHLRLEVLSFLKNRRRCFTTACASAGWSGDLAPVPSKYDDTLWLGALRLLRELSVPHRQS